MMLRSQSWFLRVFILAAWLSFPISVFAAKQSGVVKSGETPIAFSIVTLYEAGNQKPNAKVLGKTKSDDNGAFTISYKASNNNDSVLYLIADGAPVSSSVLARRSPIRLATVLGTAPVPSAVVINRHYRV